MRSAKTKQSTHYQPQNQQIANHTSKQTIRQSSNQNYGQFHTVKRGSRYWYFTWFSGQVLFADRHGRIDFIPPTSGLKDGLSIISVVIQHRLYVGFEMVHVLLSCEKGAISSEIDLFEKCVISRLLAVSD